jgi:hypothetical protein
MATGDQHGAGWTVVLPLQPVSIARGRREGGYTAAGEIRCDCGDHPDLDYREIFPRLQRIRGPYLIAGRCCHVRERLGPWTRSPGRCAGRDDRCG